MQFTRAFPALVSSLHHVMPMAWAGAKNSWAVAITLLCSCWFAGCALPHYRFEPSGVSAGHGTGQDEAIYNEPQNSPNGIVRVLAHGIDSIELPDGSRSPPMLHLQLNVSNQSRTETWTIDPGAERVSYPNQPEISPAYTRPPVTTQPFATVGPGEMRIFDFYYPLPGAPGASTSLMTFDFHWRLRAGRLLVAETTSFDRVAVPGSFVAVYPYEPYPFSEGWGREAAIP